MELGLWRHLHLDGRLHLGGALLQLTSEHYKPLLSKHVVQALAKASTSSRLLAKFGRIVRHPGSLRVATQQKSRAPPLSGIRYLSSALRLADGSASHIYATWVPHRLSVAERRLSAHCGLTYRLVYAESDSP